MNVEGLCNNTCNEPRDAIEFSLTVFWFFGFVSVLVFYYLFFIIFPLVLSRIYISFFFFSFFNLLPPLLSTPLPPPSLLSLSSLFCFPYSSPTHLLFTFRRPTSIRSCFRSSTSTHITYTSRLSAPRLLRTVWRSNGNLKFDSALASDSRLFHLALNQLDLLRKHLIAAQTTRSILHTSGPRLQFPTVSRNPG
jgi:hypothetical protein